MRRQPEQFTVPLLDLKAQYREIEAEIMEALRAVCADQQFILGPRVKELEERIAEYSQCRYGIGVSSGTDALLVALMALGVGPGLDLWTVRRQAKARYYDSAFAKAGLEADVSAPRVLHGYRHIFNQYVLRVERRDELKAYLNDAKIGSEIYYPIPLHRQKCFDSLGYGPEDFPESSRAADETLALPIYPELTEAQRQYVVQTISAFYGYAHQAG